MTDEDDLWISAGEAIKLLKPVMGEFSAQLTICARANDHLITARAIRLVIEDYNWRPAKIAERDGVAVPSKFWWARGDQTLTQNWSTGDFETWIDKQVHYKAYGVKFLRADIMSMVPPAAPKSTAHTRATQAKKGEKIFIGHGRSNAWRELKDFIVERLKLPHDEFNAEPSAGIANVARLKKMLDEAAFAFLVLTAEDEKADGQMQARMNVVHEAGLFQGRLGFEKAIILLEEGCAEFSNIHGLGQIRFLPGSISAKFEEVRRVLEREGIIQRS
jgi:predicted nucleotide-binding protein